MEDRILYDLITYEEWMREPEILHQVGECFWQHRGPLLNKLWKVTRGTASAMIKTLKTQFRFQTSFGCPPQHLITIQNNKLSWDLCVSSDGMFVAILQDDIIEIRTVSDNFSSVIGTFEIETEGLPQWRKIAWSERNTILAYSNSFGDVYVFHLRGEQKCVIPQPQRSGLNVPGTLSQAVAFLKFVACPDDEKWDVILYVGTYQGYLNCYYLKENVSTYEERCSLSLLPYHPYGIACMAFDQKNQLLIVAGSYGDEPYVSESEPCYASHCGVSVWRILTDTPHFALVEDRGKMKKVSTKELITKLLLFRRKEEGYLRRGIYRIYLSPDASMLITLHLDGRIALWNVPSFKLAKTWHKSEQPNYKVPDTSDNLSRVTDDDTSSVIDIKWWSEGELVLARGNGAVTVATRDTLANLLGESPERFECWPSLSEAISGHVLVLECEKSISTPGEKQKQNGAAKKWLSEKEEEDLYSFRSKMKEISKQVMYFLTDAERFLPAMKPPKILTNTYRLVCLKSTTPEELYARKILLEHYGDALDLAKRFGLNTDLVYQRQWRSKPVTIVTIHDYLTKIKDRYWVLDECVMRIPEDFESTEHLLKYGLLGTSWEIIQRIDDADEADLKFFIEPNNDFAEENEDEDEKKFSGPLSPKQLKLCRYRRQLYRYLDRLSTYEIILGDSSKGMPVDSYKARERYDAKYFNQFRSCNIVHQAQQYAQDENSIALEHLFSYYGKDILPHWLPILSNFPETADVADLDHVIPEIGETAEDPEILPWHEMFHRDLDWVEQEDVIQQLDSNANEDIGQFLYNEQPELKEFRNCNSKKVLHDWFVRRIYEIEETSKQIDRCCDLLELGIKRGLTGLVFLKSNLETLRTLTYEVNIDSSLGLKELMELDHLSKLKLLMSKSTEDHFVRDLKKFVMPYLDKIGLKSMVKKNKLLKDFLVDIAKSDLTCCFKLFQASQPSMSEPIIADIGLLMQLAMDCIFICKRDDQLDLVFSIVECLPNREEGMPESLNELHDKLDDLELVLGAAEILDMHAYPLTISYVHENKDDANVAEDIIRELIKSTVLKNPAATPSEWNVLLEHLIKLVKDVFKCVEVKRCHEMFVKGLLQSNSRQNITIAQELLTPSRHGSLINTKDQHLRSALYILKYDVSVNLIVETATEYFNSAAFLGDDVMDLASLCLSMITDKPNVVVEELDLISSLSILEEFHVTMLPLQVRLCPDKFEIVDKCLKEKPGSYKKSDKLLQLGDLLRICGEDEKARCGEIRIKVAEKALEQKDYTFASNICHQLIGDRYEKAWDVCEKLGVCASYTDCASREKLLSFAMTFCPPIELENILKANTLLKTQIIYDDLRVHVNQDLDEDADVNGIDGSLVKATTKKTMKLLSSVKNMKWIEHAMSWTSTASGVSTEDSTEVSEKLHCHPYYDTVIGKGTTAKYDIDEFCQQLQGSFSDEKVFNELMLRSQKLSERRAEGEVIEDTDQELLSLARQEFESEAMKSCAYLLSVSSSQAVQEFFEKQKRTKFMLRFASYYYALQLYASQNKLVMPSHAPGYMIPHKEIVNNVLNRMEADELDENENSKQLISYLKTFADMQQAEMLQNLGKGVDVERFSHDDAYKKETILGLAMNLNDQIIKICFGLAEKYSVALWEVLLSHVEFLFTDSELKAAGIRDELKKWEIEEALKSHGDDVFDRLSRYVYPEIEGTDHNKLLLFYVLLSNVSSPTKMLGETLSLDSHVKILKKIKAAAQKMDYKELVHGDAPLAAVEAVVLENNVHLLAKISAKIPKKDGTFLTPEKVFLVYLKKAFWNPDRSNASLDWIHHFETYQKIFQKLDNEDIPEFADYVTFTEQAYTTLSVDIRADITNRILKLVRQKVPTGATKGEKPTDKAVADHTKALNHIEKSLKHLKSLQGQIFLDFANSASCSHQSFAKQYDMSGGDPNQIKSICVSMFKNFQSPHLIAKILSLDEYSASVQDVFKAALQELLDDIQQTGDSFNISELVNVVKISNDNNADESVITVEHFLEVIRPFCSSQNVEGKLKSEVLRLLKESFELSGEDVFLLVWLQTDAIVTAKWDTKITSEDIDSTEKRTQLFSRLLSESSSSVQTSGLQELLSSWPVEDCDNCSDSSNPWHQLILKRIELSEYNSVMDTLHLASKRTELRQDNLSEIYAKLKESGEFGVGCKVMLDNDFPECSDMVFTDLLDHDGIEMDEELMILLIEDEEFFRIVECPVYEHFVNKLLSLDSKDDYVKKVIDKLHCEGFLVEAGTLYMKSKGIHPSFCSLYNALATIKKKL